MFGVLIVGGGALLLYRQYSSWANSRTYWTRLSTIIGSTKGVVWNASDDTLKMAVMNLDELLNDVLLYKNIGAANDNKGNRLRLANSIFEKEKMNGRVWSAHKLRNEIAHKGSASRDDLEKAIESFEMAITYLLNN